MDGERQVSMVDLAKSKQKGAGRPKGSGFLARLSARVCYQSQVGNRILFSIKDDLLKEACLSLGDPCDVMFSFEAMQAIIYKRDGGYAISKESRTSFDGRLFIPFVEESGFPNFKSQTAMKILEVRKAMIVFYVPIKSDETALAAKILESHSSKKSKSA